MRRLAISVATLALIAGSMTSLPASAVTGTVAPAADKKITMTQVKKNASAKRCWTAISGNVYDLTTWINRHPGGADRILSICGKDGTKAFGGKHGLTSSQATLLAQFKVGRLSK